MHSKLFKIAAAICTLGMMLSVSAFAKNKVSGTVVDANGQPLIGAGVVLVSDKTVGSITDVDGAFTLNAAPGTQIEISSIGYKTQILSASAGMKIVLEEDVNLLDDVVVIGYGTARKGDLTGAIGSVNGSKIEERSATMLSTALQGQVAGLQVTRTAG